MDSRIPVPTDNIYKFYALFGLLVAVFCAGSIIYVTKTTNELKIPLFLELQELKQVETPTALQTLKFQIVQRQMEVATADKKFFETALSFGFALSLYLLVYGFWKWHRIVQPKQDKLLDLQIRKLERELSES
jgi:hypothetical protein